MAAFQFFSSTPAQSWLFGSMVLMVALVAHAFAHPYEDPLIDVCEFFSLVSILFVALSSIVFAVLDDPAHPNMQDRARFVSRLCEVMSMVMIFANSTLGMFIEVRVYCHVLRGEEDYKVRMATQAIETTQAIEDAKEEVLRLEGVLEKAKANVVKREVGTEDNGDTGSARIQNPIIDEEKADEQEDLDSEDRPTYS